MHNKNNKSISRIKNLEDESLDGLQIEFMENSVSDVANASQILNNTQSSFNMLSSKRCLPKTQSKSINLFIQMEYCANGSLSKFVKNNPQLSSGEICMIFTQILNGLVYIHEKGFIHRDLKPGNIFISKNGIIKIGDFGLITYIESDTIQEFNNSGNFETSPKASPIKISPRVISVKNNPNSNSKNHTLDDSKNSSNILYSKKSKKDLERSNKKSKSFLMSSKDQIPVSPIRPRKKRFHNKSFKETLKKSFIDQPVQGRKKTLNLSTKIGTPFYTAPECQTDGGYDYKADVYSLGVILFELFSKFTTMHERNVVFTKFKKHGKVAKEFREKYGVVSDLVELLCIHNPAHRPYASQVKQSDEYKRWTGQFN